MNISNVNGAYWFRAENGKVKTDKDNGFAEVFAAENTKETAAEPVSPKSSEPSYVISGEDAEYFREKYGDEYNEDTAYKLYYELADKGIISKNDASTSSGVLEILCVDGFSGELNGGMGTAHLRVNKRVFVNDVCRTDENAYKHEWDSFKGKYDRDVTTWKDAVQESIDFEKYLKENKSSEDYLLQWHFNSVIESLEKTKGVIFQIFGRDNL